MQIIVHGKSGFHIDPYHGDQAAALMEGFFEAAAKDISAWEQMSKASLQRIEEKYTWALYADRLMTLTRVYRYRLKKAQAFSWEVSYLSLRLKRDSQ